MAKILNIETSTEICSVCISENAQLLAIAESHEGYNHSSNLTIFIQKCLKEAKLKMEDIDAIALSQGPGSYTGLRIGVSVAKGICYALNKPMIAVDTLQALAFAAAEKHKTDVLFCPMIDARRMEVYTAIYNLENEIVDHLQAKIIDSNSFINYFEEGKKILFCGNGAEKCKEVISSPNAQFSSIKCSAKHLISISEEHFKRQTFEDIAYFSPLYFKAPNITLPKKIL